MSTAAAIGVRPSPARSAMALAGWVGVTFAAAAMGGFFLPGDRYARLQKPVWNPPNWIFGPVWTALYTIMAVTAWLVWKRGGFADRTIASGSETLVFSVSPAPSQSAWFRARVWLQQKQ